MKQLVCCVEPVLIEYRIASSKWSHCKVTWWRAGQFYCYCYYLLDTENTQANGLLMVY